MDQVQFAPAGQMEARSLAEIARELFNDPDFAQLCERGMNAQLQRTKDGATDKSRIAELAGRQSIPFQIFLDILGCWFQQGCAAGLVKTLRRGLKEMRIKSTAFVDAGLNFEKKALAQVIQEDRDRPYYAVVQREMRTLSDVFWLLKCRSGQFSWPMSQRANRWRRTWPMPSGTQRRLRQRTNKPRPPGISSWTCSEPR